MKTFGDSTGRFESEERAGDDRGSVRLTKPCAGSILASILVDRVRVAVVARSRPRPAPVADAAMTRDRDAVKTLLKSGADVNAAQGDGMTALHWAARNGDAELAQMLLFAGANVKATTRLGGYTPLMMAAEQGHADGDRGAALGRRRCEGRQRHWHHAADAGRARPATPQAVTTLVENGAEIEAKEKTLRPDAADVCGVDQSRRRGQGADQGWRERQGDVEGE